MPAALPELRTALLLSGGLSWSLAVGAEYLGLPNGLGAIMATAEAFTNTGRMMIVAALVATCALSTFVVLNWIFDRVVRWVPRSEAATDVAAGAAALAGPIEEPPGS
jgi:ABC-type nitrate/sulfonate/bicarbonate transport system permease component